MHEILQCPEGIMILNKIWRHYGIDFLSRNLIAREILFVPIFSGRKYSTAYKQTELELVQTD